jgi:hypothetical protein
MPRLCRPGYGRTIESNTDGNIEMNELAPRTAFIRKDLHQLEGDVSAASPEVKPQ